MIAADLELALEPGRCWLFAYGTLQPGLRPPRSTGRALRDRVRGRLFALAKYPAAVAIGCSDEWFEGCTLDIAESELGDLDDFEGVAEGLYRRMQTTTERGFVAWVYEYAMPLPESACRLARWPAE